MSASLSSEVEVQDGWPDSIVYRLPRRNLQGVRWIGIALLVFGLAIAAGVALTIVAILSGVQQGLHRHIFGYLLFFAVPSLSGLLPMWWGLALLIGRNEIRIADGYILKRERVGPFFYSKRWKLDALTTLSVSSIFSIEEPRRLPAWLHHFDSLRCSGSTLKDGVLAWGYPPAMLEPLATTIAERCDQITSGTPMPDTTPRKPIAVISDYNGTLKARLSEDEEADLEDDDFDEDDEDFDVEPDASTIKPADTLIVVQSFDDGLTIQVPPAGLRRGTSGLFSFSLVWNGAMLLFTALTLFAISNNHQGNNEGGGWIVGGIFLLFWAVGIGLLCAAINMGLRKAAIAVAGDALMVIQSGPFGVKRKERQLADVSDVIVGPSGMQVNDVDVLELQIHSSDSPKFGMLAGRPDAELRWLASLLRDATRRNPHVEVSAHEES